MGGLISVSRAGRLSWKLSVRYPIQRAPPADKEKKKAPRSRSPNEAKTATGRNNVPGYDISHNARNSERPTSTENNITRRRHEDRYSQLPVLHGDRRRVRNNGERRIKERVHFTVRDTLSPSWVVSMRV